MKLIKKNFLDIFLHIKTRSNYYQKHKLRLQKEAFERYQILSEKEKDKKQKKDQKDMKI